MTKEGVFEVGDTITIGGITLKAVLADIDGSGCYVCDNGKQKCYFLNREIPCPRCHSPYFGFIDFVGPRVIFVKSDKL